MWLFWARLKQREYSGADLRLRKGDDWIDSNPLQVYVNVKVMNDTHLQAARRTLWERGLPA
ncbi:hypothetical protein, partial [Pseudomonas putida]|uniref:hypothetical protein n=1 Tax=Pseudomonas putida TaxID=303 RepID=UPI001ED94572